MKEEGPGHYVAAELRDGAQDRAEGRGPWEGVTRTCRRCGRPALSLEDGECPGCQNDAEMRCLRRQSEVEKVPRYRRIAEGWHAQGMHDQAEALLVYVAKLEGEAKA